MNLPAVRQLSDVAVAGLGSAITRRLYSRHIDRFLSASRQFTRQDIQIYLHAIAGSNGAASANQALSSIKYLARELREHGLLDEVSWQSIHSIRTQRSKGVRTGNWLTLDQVRTILALPDRTTLTGIRDSALLGTMVGCGLRREEASRLDWAYLQSRAGRQCIVDLVGKKRRIRTIPVPGWAEQILDEWRAHNQQAGAVFRQIRGSRLGNRLSASGIWWIIKGYAYRIGVPGLAPHDLRRTYARLCKEGGAEMEQIQLTLGHASIQTTERYVNAALRLEPGKGAGDAIKI